ncbi:MAG: DNA alkylation repair protein [Candidatus Erginobacter occultus]|nr:DNA alkylation repair protein [Candidatus Erginobacter occultus]
MKAPDIIARLRKLGDPARARVSRRFFKTGPGEYGEGDIFVGVPVPRLRKLAQAYRDLPLPEITRLLKSPLHEARLLALLILVARYRAGDGPSRERIYTLYLENTRRINSWDLVDSSAEQIIGAHLRGRGRSPLYSLARSSLLWERRIAIMATFHFIRRGEFEETMRVAEILLADPEALVRKAVGWMLREVGNRDRTVEEKFLKPRYQKMDRTMLRSAIEKFPGPLRRRYLRGEA